MQKDSDDNLILERFRDPRTKESAFNQLLQKYQQRIYWHVRRMVIDHDDADDLVQDIFIKVWKNLEGFREDAQLYTWLYRIASNECITFLNRKKMRIHVPLDEVVENSLTESSYFSGDKIQRKLQAAVATLPEKQRLVFNMKYFENMKYEDISKVLGTSVGALKASYHIAVKKIEEYITRD
jgi:RNA polymerase sigma-70 factor (family 1)